MPYKNMSIHIDEYAAKNAFQANVLLPLLRKMPRFVKKMRLPIKMVTNMNGLVNNPAILKILKKDKKGAGSWVELGFLLSMTDSVPLIEGENFTEIPVLLCHPEKDFWTPVHISELFFDRIASKTKKVTLQNAGHFPVEMPGIAQFEKAVVDFIRENIRF